ncbi:MAG: DUF4340 domain-containing protein [Leptospiraceae bacterium]|nr:DUF4340 domain-containing protein [Leptospiraceae bacterium]MDW7975613.1 DUF4340 domain-containing protein [Leptospiraceae bacterium]
MKFFEIYKKNLGFSLFITNVFLFFLWMLIQDPFHLLSKAFEPSSEILKFDYKNLQNILIEFPDKGLKYTLENQSQLTSEKNIKTLDDFLKQTDWKFTLSDLKTNQKEEYTIDKDNLKSFIETLLEAKQYYHLPLNSENQKLTGIHENSAKIQIQYTNQKQDILTIGNVSVRNNSSYVVLNDEKKIFQVEGNLKTKSGYDDKYYFRNHKILTIEKDKIEKIIVEHNNQRYTYAKASTDWQILEPRPEKIGTSIEGILDEIANLKATTFYNFQKPQEKDLEEWNVTFQIFISQPNQPPQIEKLEFFAKKDYVKFYLKHKDQYYQVSAYRIEDLLEPQKLVGRN